MRIFSAILGILLCATGALAGVPDFVEIPEQARYHANMGDASVVLGGQLPNDKFVPSVRADKWDGEAYVELFAHKVTVGNNKEVKSNGKITLEVGNEKHRFYPLSETSIEYEIEFATRPTSNEYPYRISMSPNVKYAKQIISQADLDNGHSYSRPDAEGSYAFYIDKMDNKYKSGKVAHIWRPKLIDAVGTEWWCDMDIQGNILTITMPTEALDNAVYPLRLDPELGYSSQGALIFSASLTSVLTRHFQTDATGGTIQSFHAWASTTDGTDDDFLAVGAYEVDQATFSPAGKALVEFGRTVGLLSATPIEMSVAASGSGVLAANTYYGIGRQIAVPILYDSGFAAVNAYFYLLAGATDDWGDPCPATTTAPNWTIKYSAWLVYGAAPPATGSRTKLGYPKMIEMSF